MLPSHLLLNHRYRIVRLIGEGGMGAVYEAVDQQQACTVAVKQTRRGDQRTFTREVRLLTHLDHPALPRIFDYFSDDEGQFLVMEYVGGDDLAMALLRQEAPYPAAVVLAWADQLLTVLTYLHSQQPPVLHRDIKPANLKVTATNKLMLLDFGLAKGSLGQTSPSLQSATGYTLRYAAPEQIRGEGADPRSDLYSAAATLYHLFTGLQPADAIQRALALAHGQPDPLWQVQSEDSQALAIFAVLRKALALNPAERYASAEAMRVALQSAATADLTIVVPTTISRVGAASRPAQPHLPTPNNLPAQLTPLVGRDRDLAKLQQRLTQASVRLVTLTGPGGIGKTRLAQAVAAQLLSSFPDGVYFISLAALGDANLVLTAVARTLAVRESANTPLLTSLGAALGERAILLVLDNFEHVIEAATFVTDLLTCAPRLKILATSRAVLHLRGEHEFIVPPLALPNLAQLPPVDALAQVAAVALFVQCAQAVDFDFVLDAGNAQAVAAICTVLEGLPLTIELAVARLKHYALSDLAARLSPSVDSSFGRRLHLLREGARDLPQRQRTLLAALDWSYTLLTEAEQTLFRRLAVFIGGFTLEAAEAVCTDKLTRWQADKMTALPPPVTILSSSGNPEGAAILSADLLFDGIASLVDKSLLRRVQEEDQSPDKKQDKKRWHMLATIQEYAAQRLAESGETTWLRQRHAAHYLAVVEQAETALTGPDQATWLNRLETEHNNVRAALQWLETSGEAELGLRMGGALWRFWSWRGHLTEARLQLQRLLTQLSASAASEARAKALNAAGILAHIQGDFGAARLCHEESLTIRRALGLEATVADSLNNLGILAKEVGDYTTATHLYTECLVIRRKLGQARPLALTLTNLAGVHYRQGAYASARTLYTESLASFRTLGDKHSTTDTLINLGLVAHQQGDTPTAVAAWQEGLTMAQELGYKWGTAVCLLNLGDLARDRNDYPAARSRYGASLTLMQELGDKRLLAEALQSIGCLALAQAHFAHALYLFGAADGVRKTIGAPLPVNGQAQFDQQVTVARQSLNEEDAAQIWADSQAGGIEQAIIYARQQLA